MSPKDQYAQVILPLAVEGTFTYTVPGSLAGRVMAGSRVLVSFGRKRIYSGVVHSLVTMPPENLIPKSISSLLDEAPLVTQEQLQLWEWMSSYYMCSLGEVMRAALPSGLRPESESRIRVRPGFGEGLMLEPHERLLLEVIREQGELTMKDLELTGISTSPLTLLKKLVEMGAVEVNEFLRFGTGRKINSYLRLTPPFASEKALHQLLDGLTRAQRQRELMERFLQHSQTDPFHPDALVPKGELTRAKGGPGALAALMKKGVFEQVDKEELGPQKPAPPEEHATPFQLSSEQQVALAAIKEQFRSHQAVLLHGVTSSGKTELYTHLIREAMDQGGQVLYLLPEIALTTQIIARLKRIFGKRVGIYHSRYSDSDRVHVYRNLLGWTDEESYRLIIGVRSALFLPFRSLRLIIVDEEHEITYKQHDPAPRYHARDSAQLLAIYHGAKVLMGTATPSFETLFNARTGKFGYVTLPHRFGNAEEPEVIIADTREAMKRKQMVSHFTPRLLTEIRLALDHGEQVILFQNRRGYSNYLVCGQCGYVPKCSRCDVSLTLHRQSGKLECHYCGHREPVPGACPSCHETALIMKGFGTEKVEDEIALLFEGIRVGRLDTDSVHSVRGFERVIHDFEQGKTDLLIGTQMLTKGLDFDRVNLVGVLDADNMMNFPDFRSFERSYQLISQVSGRGGRREKRGKVIIQTMDPTHPVIRYLERNDYEGLYRAQMEERELFGYPPYKRMIRIVFRHRVPSILDAAARLTGSELKRRFSSRVFGPQDPPVKKVQNYYLKQIILKIEREASYERARELLKEVLEEVSGNAVYRSIRISVDVDPY
jgi:primosomal protein N' (replication factor Y)